MEDLVYARLRDDDGFGALAGDRYYSVEKPANAPLPHAVGEVLSEVRAQAMGSAPGNVQARLQVSSFATRPGGARALAAAVRASLHRWRDSGSTPPIEDVLLATGREFYDAAAGVFVKEQDYLVFYRE